MQPEHSTQGPERAHHSRERALVFTFTSIVALATAHFVHDAWNHFALVQEYAGRCSPNPGRIAGPVVLYAPDAYRVAMPALLTVLSRLVPTLPASTLLAGVDAILLLVTLPMVYLLSTRSSTRTLSSGPERSLRIVLALLFAVAALPWLAQYARTETMPTGFFLLASALCLRKRAAWCLPLQVGLTVIQAFVRSDVPICFGLALLLVSLFRKSVNITERRLNIAWGLAALLAAGLVQGYLQFIRFPHLTYVPGVQVWQAVENLLPHRWINGGLAVGPVCLAILYGLRRGGLVLLDNVDCVCVLAAVLYLPLWFAVGSLAEPRIFLPFLLLLSPLAGRLVALSLSPVQLPELPAKHR